MRTIRAPHWRASIATARRTSDEAASVTKVAVVGRHVGYLALQFLVLIGMFARTVPLDAQAAGELFSDPTFFVERIEVRTSRANRGPLQTALRLEAGRSYRESELRQAVYRVQRLPFVLEARMSLEKGTQRDRYLLVLEVEETARFFLVSDSTLRYRPSETVIGLFPDPESPGETTPVMIERRATFDFRGDVLSAGMREFVGQDGMAFATINDGSLGVGYTQYNLFGTRAFGTVAVGKSLCCDGSGLLRENDLGIIEAADLEASLAVGLPVGRNQSFQLNFTWTETSDQIVRDGVGVDARWFHDTTDDPFFPTRGFRLSAALGFFETELRSRDPLARFERESDDSVASLSGSRYFDLSRHTLWLGGEARVHRQDGFERAAIFDPIDAAQERTMTLDGEETSLRATFGWARTLLAPTRQKRRELRLESTLDVTLSDESGDLAELFERSREDDLETVLGVSLAYRNRWSVIRFGIGYRDGDTP